MTAKLTKADIWEMCKSNLLFLLGIVIYVISYVCFLLPYQLISGGMNGISTTAQGGVRGSTAGT